ncbi:hypothetical protein TNCV_3336411 [Trichonephila clavipes]|nr:hypothetical protein TNCV_3336411 [Trichonephila clavipes]
MSVFNSGTPHIITHGDNLQAHSMKFSMRLSTPSSLDRAEQMKGPQVLPRSAVVWMCEPAIILPQPSDELDLALRRGKVFTIFLPLPPSLDHYR